MKRKLTLFANIDVFVTNLICRSSHSLLNIKYVMEYMQLLEYSCHGLVWLVGTLLSIWMLWAKSLFQNQVNLFLGIVLDIIFVGSIKLKFQRRRPAGNQQGLFELGPDTYSFPSGHVSRAFFLLYIFVYICSANYIFAFVIFLWCLAIAYSRILLRKHYLGDVIAGMLLGLFEGWLITNCLWISEKNSLFLVEWITNSKFYGSDDDL